MGKRKVSILEPAPAHRSGFGTSYVVDSLTALINIENRGKMIMPVIVKVVQSNGQRGGTWTFKYASKSKIDKVLPDPENVLPDVDRKIMNGMLVNNVLVIFQPCC